jgi:hypothetical protein
MDKRTSALNKNPQKLNSVEKKHSFKPKLGFTTGIVLGVSSAIALSTTASVGDGLSTIQSSLNQTSNTSTNITNSYTNTTTSTIPTLSASPFAASSNATAAQSAIEASSVGCGDASQQGSIAWTQQEVIKNRQILNTAPVDIDALFNGSKGSSSGSCFSDITKIIDLSVAIPDWGGMRAAAIAALRQYAQRKVCTMVNEATKKALEPLNNAIDIINKNGTIDLNGAVQGAITGGLGKLDPDLANIYQTQAPQGETVNIFDSNQTTFNTDVAKVQDQVNGAINQIGTIGTNTGSTGSTNPTGTSGTTWSNNTSTQSIPNLSANTSNQTQQKAQPQEASRSSIFDALFGGS